MGKFKNRGHHLPYLAAIAIAFFSPPVALGLIGATAFYYILENTPVTSADEAVPEAPPDS